MGWNCSASQPPTAGDSATAVCHCGAERSAAAKSGAPLASWGTGAGFDQASEWIVVRSGSPSQSEGSVKKASPAPGRPASFFGLLKKVVCR